MSLLLACARSASFLAVASLALAQAPTRPADSPEFFETKVRPVLAANCFSCHTSNKMGGLRVDSSEALLTGGKTGPAIVPGDPDKSLLLQLVKHADAKKRMPMGSKLKDDEIAALDAWIRAGAKWPKTAATQTAQKSGDDYVIHPEQRKFWSFQPLKNPEPPAVKNVKWANTAIDKFILARLEKEGIAPVKPASRRDLIRRATLGLTGLPPTIEEIEAFEKDTSKDAWAKVVDRLLASPHYGERLGRFWLDVARYGEDDYRSLDPMRRGYNPYPNAYLYRDWVVKAFNDDLPFDQFVKAQVAGDQMDEKIRYQTIAATGFLGLGPWYYDNGAVEVTRADERHDRVDAITRGFLGLTVACARCHDHKYDPIPTKDYYSLAGVFYNTQYEEYPLAPKSVVDKFAKIEEAIDTKQKLLMETQMNLTAQLARTLAFETANYLEGVFEVTGKPKKEIADVVEARKLDYELLARWIRYMGRTTDKYKNKDAWQAMIKKGGSPEEAKKLAEKLQSEVVAVMLARAEIDEENKVIADKAIEGTKRKKRTNKPSNFVTNDDFCPGCALQLKSLPEDQNFFFTEVFQRELNDSDDPNAMMAMGGRFGKPGVLMFRGWGLEKRLGAEALAQINSIKTDIEAERKKIEPFYPFAHGVKDLPNIKDLPLSIRGNPENLGPEVPRHFLSVLSEENPKPFSKGSGRLELAEAIVKQPIAMRVFVNRIWRSHFGTGIVDTPSNFGTTGERPTNPELLEYLATYFVNNGLSVKKLQREILMSSVYQLSSEDSAAAFAKDSGNRLYWRFNKQRMDAEQLRDSVLRVAGNLEDSLGGPSEELSPANKRRTLYGKVSRYKLDEYLQLFDFPNPNISAERRFTTTVPLQRLFLMNSDFMQVQAEALAKRVINEADNRSRVKKMYELVYGRVPTEQEIQVGLAYIKSEPLLEYEESKKKADEKKGDKKDGKPGDEMKAKPTSEPALPEMPSAAAGAALKPEKKAEALPETKDAKPETKLEAKADEDKGMEDMDPEEKAKAMMGKAMMSGVMGNRRGGPAGPPPVKYEPTVWGRYAKVLLSSSEFLFIN
jgi:mono/diheme cytochrome c family protein